MRRTYTYTFCLIMALLVGCKSEYPHIEYEGDLEEVVYDNIDSPVPITVAVNDPLYASYTRGVGVFEDLEGYSDEKWKSADFYIYAFYSPYAANNIDDANYSKPMDSKDNENYWCLVDDAEDEGLGHGKRARLDEDGESFLHWTNESRPEYNKKYQQHRYKFFAYYIDDAAGDMKIARPIRKKNQVAYDINIDGTQDIMCGYASPTEKQKENLVETGEKDILNNLDRLAYSTTTGHRDLHPIFTMKHQLAYLKFHMKAGTTGANKVDAAAFDVQIKNISIEAQTKGEFIVAAEDYEKLGAKFKGPVKELYMPTIDSEGKVVPGTENGFEPYKSPTEEEQEVGAFLVPAAEQYVLKLKCRQPKLKSDGTPERDEQGNPEFITYTVKYIMRLNNESFKAGYRYDITIHVYGHQRIKLGLGAVTWETGENVVIDDEISGGDHELEYEYGE